MRLVATTIRVLTLVVATWSSSAASENRISHHGQRSPEERALDNEVVLAQCLSPTAHGIRLAELIDSIGESDSKLARFALSESVTLISTYHQLMEPIAISKLSNAMLRLKSTSALNAHDVQNLDAFFGIVEIAQTENASAEVLCSKFDCGNSAIVSAVLSSANDVSESKSFVGHSINKNAEFAKSINRYFTADAKSRHDFLIGELVRVTNSNLDDEASRWIALGLIDLVRWDAGGIVSLDRYINIQEEFDKKHPSSPRAKHLAGEIANYVKYLNVLAGRMDVMEAKIPRYYLSSPCFRREGAPP